MEILGLIPARGGSRSIPRKNLVPLAGRPLIEYTFDAARLSKRLTRSIVSTDNTEIASISRAYGMEVPFVRPSELSADDTPMLAVVRHAQRWLLEREGYVPHAIVLLQPTSPLRRARHIDDAVDLFIRTSADTVVSVVDVPHQYNPVSLMKVVDGRLVEFMPANPVYRRQDKAPVYARNGPAVLVVSVNVLDTDRLYGENTVPYLMSHPESVDLDTPEDLSLAEFRLRQQ